MTCVPMLCASTSGSRIAAEQRCLTLRRRRSHLVAAEVDLADTDPGEHDHIGLPVGPGA